MSDPINPEHYGAGTEFETIKVLAAWMPHEWMIGLCRGQAIQYLSRAGKKGDITIELQDLKKAIWYTKKEFEIRTGEKL